MEQRFFEVPPSDPGASGYPVDKFWIPSFSFASEHRLLSLGLGDLGWTAGLKVLMARNLQTLSISPGLGERAGVTFEHSVGYADVAGAELSVEHLTQNTSIADQSEFKLGIELKYELSFMGR